MTSPLLTSLLRCPGCGHEERLDMPTDACLFFHECAGCRTLLRPKAGDCCVFCSYGSVPCPPIQAGGACGGAPRHADGAGDADCCGATRPAALTAAGPRPPRGERVNRVARLADGAGVVGAAFAALCCAGTPLIVSALAAVGLSFLRNDAILWPLMFASLAVAIWGFWRGRAVHGAAGPLGLAAAGGVALVAGVVFIHGFPAKQVIWAGAAALVAETFWNLSLRRGCAAMPGGLARMSARP